ncbi:CcmA Integral membrane protein CcmA involved in cell shape determination [Methylophilaceae bacterium]
MFFKKSNRSQNSIETLVGADTQINGDVHFSGGLRVDGAIRGDVSEPNASPSTLILSENGSIEGAVTASKIVINGKVTGTVKAGQFIEMQSKARIIGDLHYKSLEMHTGAVIEGKLVYLADNVQALED